MQLKIFVDRRTFTENENIQNVCVLYVNMVHVQKHVQLYCVQLQEMVKQRMIHILILYLNMQRRDQSSVCCQKRNNQD